MRSWRVAGAAALVARRYRLKLSLSGKRNQARSGMMAGIVKRAAIAACISHAGLRRRNAGI